MSLTGSLSCRAGSSEISCRRSYPMIEDDPMVGFVGLGNMGWPMASNLARAGFRLTVRDADAGRQERFAAEHGCAAAREPAAFGATPVVVTMLPHDGAVRGA